MAKFTDASGREWNLRLDYFTVRQLRKSLSIDLLNLNGQGEAFAKMGDNLELLVNAIYLICEDQCSARGVSDEDFGRALAGDSFSLALIALQEACISFLPPPDRAAAKRLLDLLKGAKEELTASVVSMSGP